VAHYAAGPPVWGLMVLGFAALLAVGAAGAGLAVAVEGRSQEVVYATEGGEILAVEPVSGRVREIYTGDGYAAYPSRAGGSRSLAFSVLRGSGEDLRADAYSVVDLVRETRARLTSAAAGRAFLSPEFSDGRSHISTVAYSTGSGPNVLVGPSSGAKLGPLLGAEAVASGAELLGPVWLSDESLYALRVEGEETVLVVHDLVERRRAAAHETRGVVSGPLSYHEDSNTLIFAERPRGADLSESRVRLFTGTAEGRVRGADGLGLYDPSPPIPSLGGKVAVMWTDGEATGVGLLDGANSWSFSKTGMEAESGARYPQVSQDGAMIATAKGEAITVREMWSGETVRAIRDAQTPEDAPERLREAGLEVPKEAVETAPPSFGWRSLEDD